MGANGRHVVMEPDDDATPITQEFPFEPQPIVLTEDDVIDERPIVMLH